MDYIYLCGISLSWHFFCFFLPHRFFEMSNLPKRRRRLKPSLAVVYKAYGMEREKVKRRTILEKASKKARSWATVSSNIQLITIQMTQHSATLDIYLNFFIDLRP